MMLTSMRPAQKREKAPVAYPGKAFPLGATYTPQGVNFALYADKAEKVELCLFDSVNSPSPLVVYPVAEVTNNVWHIYIPGLPARQAYGFRVYGRFDPQNGYRFNHHKLLIDPNTKAMGHPLIWDDSLFGYQIGHPDQDLSYNETDSAPFAPKSLVIDPHFDWGDDLPPDTPFNESIIYEVHVKGFTRMNEAMPEDLRGTYAGLSHPSTLAYLKSLGVTAVELMPVHTSLDDRHLIQKGLRNYWGYNSIGFFSPDARYAAGKNPGDEVNEFKQMVKDLHREGIEVILDVVYNHTGEGNHMGPTLSYRGIDNICYYRLQDNKRHYMDYTGTGNTLNVTASNVLRLIMDSLRYWIQEMHVDGFRFDLASTLAREFHAVNMLGTFFDIIHQDPVISQVKLIAEPWDLGEGGYQVGNFPPEWAEWNDRFRNGIREFWKGDEYRLAEFAQRFTGSADLFQNESRKPLSSINFITAHDGFTLEDLVSYNNKHNEANLENNEDGANDNHSCNHGAEGATDDKQILELRKKIKRNLLTTLILSQGVPMLLSGDETGHSQQGNNNAYCQDNEITWINWNKVDGALLDFTRKLIALRKGHPVFSRRRWFRGESIPGCKVKDIVWFEPGGAEMTEENWSQGFAKSLGVYLNGLGIDSQDAKGKRIVDDDFYVIFNAHTDSLIYKLPPPVFAKKWFSVLDTDAPEREVTWHEPGDSICVQARSVLILMHETKKG